MFDIESEGAKSVAIALVALIWIGNIVLGLSVIPAWRRDGAPFVRTAAAKSAAIFGERGLLHRGGDLVATAERGVASMHLVDLGSGDGTIVRAATRTGGFGRATGYEINPFLVAASRVLSFGRPAERFRCESMWDADLREVDVVVVYGLPPIMERMGAKLLGELPEHALVVSNAYELPSLGKPAVIRHVDTPLLSGDASSSLYVYRMSESRRARNKAK
ncbi:hypothetical protein KFE25_011464 [Diacronema lutheri]|uniref:DOT1 domain-containing protein n=1 Tax=Diacronema lutheri TaxID=2081491 RepID=A0A8J6C513_DIALT|nr:hypothetical protein KFE25_011464 [Diacronema lutheri]